MKAFIITIITLALATFFFTMTAPGRRLINQWGFTLQKADDSTKYEFRKKVEDTCRAMQSSYIADRLAYEQYKNGNQEEKSWAAQAKMRANTTAATYNKYILENTFVWQGNVPVDIHNQLNYLN